MARAFLKWRIESYFEFQGFLSSFGVFDSGLTHLPPWSLFWTAAAKWTQRLGVGRLLTGRTTPPVLAVPRLCPLDVLSRGHCLSTRPGLPSCFLGQPSISPGKVECYSPTLVPHLQNCGVVLIWQLMSLFFFLTRNRLVQGSGFLVLLWEWGCWVLGLGGQKG